MNKFIIRNATPQDTAVLFDFIHKMAQYEKLESEMDTSVKALHQALFVEHQAEVVIGEENGVPVGFALFFHNFSTFKGQRGLYLEELFVEEPHRGKGYGKALLLQDADGGPAASAAAQAHQHLVLLFIGIEPAAGQKCIAHRPCLPPCA